MNKFLFVVEGKKDEYRVIKAIMQFLGIQNNIVQDTNRANYFEFNNDEIYVKTIIDGNIEQFYAELTSDEFSAGISLSTFFDPLSDQNYAQEYIIIDGDFKDRITGGKKQLLIDLNDFIDNMENTKLLVTTPQLEAISDRNDKHQYISGENYKSIINTRSVMGAVAYF